jgi:hypothetical protein
MDGYDAQIENIMDERGIEDEDDLNEDDLRKAVEYNEWMIYDYIEQLEEDQFYELMEDRLPDCFNPEKGGFAKGFEVELVRARTDYSEDDLGWLNIMFGQDSKEFRDTFTIHLLIRVGDEVEDIMIGGNTQVMEDGFLFKGCLPNNIRLYSDNINKTFRDLGILRDDFWLDDKWFKIEDKREERTKTRWCCPKGTIISMLMDASDDFRELIEEVEGDFWSGEKYDLKGKVLDGIEIAEF